MSIMQGEGVGTTGVGQDPRYQDRDLVLGQGRILDLDQDRRFQDLHRDLVQVPDLVQGHGLVLRGLVLQVLKEKEGKIM